MKTSCTFSTSSANARRENYREPWRIPPGGARQRRFAPPLRYPFKAHTFAMPVLPSAPRPYASIFRRSRE
jgi:hypothetical protein